MLQKIQNPRSKIQNRLCFLSMDSLGDYVSDDELAIAPLRELGWQTETVSWRAKKVNWNDFTAVIIRTPWDYQNDPEDFLRVLGEIERSTARLENPLRVVRWNLRKTYLKDLSDAGIKIVPTIFGSDLVDEKLFDSWLEKLRAEEIIIKPIVSATAGYTYRLRNFLPELTDIFRRRPYLVQPFMENIITEGEFSLFYFGGEYSHTILKTPKPLDFRVQEEFGGIIKAVKPTEKLLRAGQKPLDFIKPPPLYARVDLVRDERDEFAVMELELIEPSLYLRMDAGAPKRFAETFDRWIKNR